MRLSRSLPTLLVYGLAGGLLASCSSLSAFSEHGTQVGLGAGVGGVAGLLVAGPWGALVAGAVGAITCILATPAVPVTIHEAPTTAWDAVRWVLVGLGVWFAIRNREAIGRVLRSKGVKARIRWAAHAFGARRPQG